MKSDTVHRHTFTLSGSHLMAGLMLVLVVLASMPACTHDPFSPIEPDPTDTMDNPMDTMDIDTMNMDTMGIPCDSNVVYFDMQILPLLKSNCAKSGCHDVTSHQKDIILDSYENLISSDIVKPFDLNGSEMYEVITETDPDKRMPEPPNQKLTAGQITLIAKWILQGAKDLTCDPQSGICDTTNVTYSGFVAPLLTTYCVGCHSGGAPSGNIMLNTYSGVQAVALNGRLLGAISWDTGFQPMPRGSSQLPSCTIDKIKSWINNGAPNN